MSKYYDGDWTIPRYNGRAQITLPLVQDQDYFTRVYAMQMMQDALYYSPILGSRYLTTNNLLWSDDLTKDVWQEINTEVAANAYTDPEGNVTGNALTETADNGPHTVLQDPGIGPGSIYASVFLRPGARKYAQIRLSNGTDGNIGLMTLDISHCSIINQTTNSIGFGSVYRMSDGWILVQFQGDATVSGTVLAIDILDDSLSTSYPGNPGSGIMAWRASLTIGTNRCPSVYTEDAARTVVAPQYLGQQSESPADYLAFLVDESPPDQGLLEQGIAQWTRSYARVPKQSRVPSSIIVTKPSVNGQGPYILSNGAFFYQISPDTESYDVYSEVDVTGDSGIPDFDVTGGTYTLSFRGDTTSDLAFDASAGDVETALNALGTVTALGSVNVSGDYTSQFDVQFVPSGGTVTEIVVDTSLLTFSGGPGIQIFKVNYTKSQITSQIWQAREIYAMPYAPRDNQITGGTYTLELFGDVTDPLDFDADSDTIKAALEALPGVAAYGGIIMYQTPYGDSGWVPSIGTIYFVFALGVDPLEGDGTNLEPQNSSVAITVNDSTYNRNQTIELISGGAYRSLFAADHGITNGGKIFVQASIISETSPATIYATTYYVPITNYQVIDQNNVNLVGTQNDGYMVAATITKVGRGILSNYEPGPQNVRCTKITDYYLPGVTFGVESADDIPVAEAQSDSYSFFQGLFSGGLLNYVVGEIGVWRGPILYQTTTQIKAFDLATYINPTIQATVAGEGSGSIVSTPAGINTTTTQTAEFESGTLVVIQAIPAEGSIFLRWFGSIGDNEPTGNPIGITPSGNVDISAVFILTG